jgi:hypothetical protein
MKTQNDDRDVVHSSAYDPFPEPQTIPSGWDISELLSAPEPAPVTEADDSAES